MSGGSSQSESQMGKVGWIIAATILSLLLLGQCSTKQPAKPAAAVKKELADSAPSWEYWADEDPMNGKKTFRATIESSNQVNFDFPYHGLQRGELMLRTHPRYGKDVILSISSGQFQCNSYNGCPVLVRFDDAKPVRYSAAEPTDNDSTYIFLQGYSGFIGRMMKAKKVRIEAEFYQEGRRVFEFDVTGFNADRYLGKRD